MKEGKILDNDYNKDIKDDIFEDGTEEEEENSESDGNFLNGLDSSLTKYTNFSAAAKKEKYVFKPGEKAIWKDKEMTIMYGPYLLGMKTMYECMDENKVIQPIASSSLIKA